MRYGISKATALDEHYLEKGQLISNLPSFLPQKACMNPVSGLFPVLYEKNGVAKFQYSNLIWKVYCGQMRFLKLKDEHESHELRESFSLIHEKLNKISGCK